MDHSKSEKKGHVLDFKNFASQTPEKTNEPLHAILKEEGVKHLEEYKNMVKLFDSMICSLRLLSLRKKPPTFQNISAQVEILAKRKFSCKHLAQMKYLFPEAIQIDKILGHDKKSLCMKPDVKIALLFDVIEDHCQHSDFMALSQAFASRLINFFTVHPEACDIPELPLPDPFVQGSQTTLGGNEVPEALESVCRKSQTIAVEKSPADSLESLLTSNNTEMLTTPSLIPPSFGRYFSQKSSDAETEQAKLLKSPASSKSSTATDNQVFKTCQLDECPVDRVPDKDMKSEQQINLPDTCLKSVVTLQLIKSECQSPQQKLSLSYDSLMIETPAQVTPTRSIPSCDNKLKATTTETCTSCYKPAKRFLDFSHLEGDRSTLVDSHGMGTHNYKVLHYGISQALDVDSKGSIEESNVTVSPALLGKVEDDKIFQSVGLPDLVAFIHQIFQSVSSSSITKQELVHKIIINNLDIIERREVEEEIELLEKLVPDWICKKMLPSGDAMYKINKVADLASVQGRVINT
ncbi:hypothetical protein LWI28_027875 [Acer negundo]|uniref:CDT1 Geminin-binding domain-containing protein n=1 Tax=Acer negundo TaxID=4023 RepID=A0AAD5IS57_ACENE|nr:hypothetical protein LWI28_027875 [Acer negundo]